MPSLLANTITPLLGATELYLIVLNALIGVLEGAMLTRWFGAGRGAKRWMILGNYVSAFLGMLVLGWLVSLIDDRVLGERPIERINLLVAMVFIGAWVLSVLIEAPFVRVATQASRTSIRRAMLASTCVNTCSYVLIGAWFLWQAYTLPLNARVVNLSDMGSLPNGTIYWVDEHGGVLSADSRHPDQAHAVGKVMLNDFVVPYQLTILRAELTDRVQLTPRFSIGIMHNGRTAPPDLEPDESPILTDAGAASAFPADYWKASNPLRKSVLDLRSPDRRTMRVDFDWYRHYLRTSTPEGKHAYLTLGFLGREWVIQEPTVLADDKILFEWAQQIVLFDPHTKRIAFVARGTCPAFIPDP